MFTITDPQSVVDPKWMVNPKKQVDSKQLVKKMWGILFQKLVDHKLTDVPNWCSLRYRQKLFRFSDCKRTNKILLRSAFIYSFICLFIPSKLNKYYLIYPCRVYTSCTSEQNLRHACAKAYIVNSESAFVGQQTHSESNVNKLTSILELKCYRD